MFTQKRGCGTRSKDGVYSVLCAGPGGEPLDNFLIDHPLPLPSGFQLAALGVQLVEFEGIYHILDWVGESHYPTVPHFWTEAHYWLAQEGTAISRKVPRTLDFSKLTRDSRHYLVHASARLMNAGELLLDERPWQCPKRHMHHQPSEWHRHFTEHLSNENWEERGFFKPHPCIGMCWQALPPENEFEAIALYRKVVRNLECGGTLRGSMFPLGVQPIFEPGIFARYPLSFHIISGEMTQMLEEEVSKADGIGYEVRDI